MAERIFAVAVDLGGTQIRAALIDAHGNIHKRSEEPTKAGEGPEIVLGQIQSLASAVCAGIRGEIVAGVGLSSPGPIDTEHGIALDIPTLAGFCNVPVRHYLEDRLGLPVVVENDGIAAAIGEWKHGAGRGSDNIVYVTVSTGIGGGAICDGRVLHGRRGLAGHVGHMSFREGGELCACGNRGCFEAYGSGTAFTRRARAAAALHPNTQIGMIAPVSAASVFDAASSGDALAQTLVEEEADILGRGFASLCHLYSPDMIIMGGGLSAQFQLLLPGMSRSMKAVAMPAFKDVPIIQAALGSNAGLVGAAGLILELPGKA